MSHVTLTLYRQESYSHVENSLNSPRIKVTAPLSDSKETEAKIISSKRAVTFVDYVFKKYVHYTDINNYLKLHLEKMWKMCKMSKKNIGISTLVESVLTAYNQSKILEKSVRNAEGFLLSSEYIRNSDYKNGIINSTINFIASAFDAKLTTAFFDNLKSIQGDYEVSKLSRPNRSDNIKSSNLEFDIALIILENKSILYKTFLQYIQLDQGEAERIVSLIKCFVFPKFKQYFFWDERKPLPDENGVFLKKMEEISLADVRRCIPQFQEIVVNGRPIMSPTDSNISVLKLSNQTDETDRLLFLILFRTYKAGWNKEYSLMSNEELAGKVNDDVDFFAKSNDYSKVYYLSYMTINAWKRVDLIFQKNFPSLYLGKFHSINSKLSNCYIEVFKKMNDISKKDETGFCIKQVKTWTVYPILPGNSGLVPNRERSLVTLTVTLTISSDDQTRKADKIYVTFDEINFLPTIEIDEIWDLYKGFTVD